MLTANLNFNLFGDFKLLFIYLKVMYALSSNPILKHVYKKQLTGFNKLLIKTGYD